MVQLKKTLLICLLMIVALIQVVGPTAAQSNSIDNVVVSVPACSGVDGRLAITVSSDGQPNRFLSNTLSGISGPVASGTSTLDYQFIPPEGTLPGSILTVSVILGTNFSLGDLDTETFSFNCSTGEKVGGPVAPFPLYDSAFTPFQTPVTINVLFNDIDTNGDLNPASTAAISGPVNGALANNGDGTFIYTPNDGYSGLDEFTYQVCDTTNLCGTAPVRLQVGNPNRPPVANDDLVATPEGVAVSIYALGNDSDPDDFPFFNPSNYVASALSNPSNGILAYTGQGSFTYTPNSGFNGVDTFTYQLCDSGGLCDDGLVTIQVGPVFHPPVAVNDSVRVEEKLGTTINVASNDSDLDGDLNPESVTILTGPANGTFSTNRDGTISYRPNDGFLGIDGFTYQICDFGNHCASASVTIEVFHIDHPPVALDFRTTIQQGDGVDFGLSQDISDPDGNLDASSLAFLNSPAHGSLTKFSDVLYRYIPDSGYLGLEILQYQVCDTTNLCATATVTIEVITRNEAPIANDDFATTPSGVPVNIDVLANDTDPDGNLFPARSSRLIDPTNGIVVHTGNGIFTYTSNPNFVGIDSFTYLACDTRDFCGRGTVTIEVVPVGNPPIANNDSASTQAGVAVVINVASNDTDSDGNLNPNSVGLLINPANGNVFNNGNGSFSYTPNNGFSGTDSFTYQICDTDNLCTSATVTIEVTAVVTNNPPDCSAARPTSRIIWPPLSVLMIPIQIRGVSDANSDRVKITITSITQNEAERGLFRGDRAPDSFGVGTRTAWLRAERDPKGTGRIYSIAFSADDGNGGTCTGTVAVTVPRSWGR